MTMREGAHTPRVMSRQAFAKARLGLSYGFHDSPLGEVIAVAGDGALAGLGFVDDRASALADMTRRWPGTAMQEDPATTAPFLAGLFEGQAPPLLLIGSDFDLEVWQALLDVPWGGSITYGDLAARLGRPKAARAIGAAVGRNPVCMAVPCHRVSGKSGAPTGYHWGLERKLALLERENKQI